MGQMSWHIALRWGSFIPVIGHLALVPLVFRLLVALGISYNDGAERNKIGRESEELAHRLAALFRRIGACPYSAQSHGMCLQQDILGHGREVLWPEAAESVFAFFIFAHVATRHDGERCVFRHRGIGTQPGNLLQQTAVSHHHEMPRLTVHCRRGSHSGMEQRVYL